VTDLRAGRSVFDAPQGQGLLLATKSVLVLGPTQLPIQRVPAVLSPGVGGRDVKLTSWLHLVPKLRVRGAISPLLHTT